MTRVLGSNPSALFLSVVCHHVWLDEVEVFQIPSTVQGHHVGHCESIELEKNAP